MSTLKTSNIQDTSGNNNSTPEEISKGRAKAWVTYRGDTNTIVESFNVSAVIDNTTGDFTINFTNAMSSINFCVAGTIANTTNNFVSHTAGATRGPGGVQMAGDVAPTTSSVTVETLYGATAAANGAKFDVSRCNVVVFGD